MKEDKKSSKTISKIKYTFWILILIIGGSLIFFNSDFKNSQLKEDSKDGSQKIQVPQMSKKDAIWKAPDIGDLPLTTEGDLIRYGRELVVHTASYLGPKGSISQISNGMNCQNCHLEAGTKPFGNNYAAVDSKYPQFRARSGTIETVEKRVNDCIERSLNGKKLDPESLEMKAFVAYLKWVGKDVHKDSLPKGIGLQKLTFLNRPADIAKGNLVYNIHCSKCHGKNGEGLPAENGKEWIYPPLYGNKSYNTGAGLFRISMFASFVKDNMPYGIFHENPVLSDEEAWDVAAFVNSMPRPEKDLSEDWPDISQKPFDHPFGPYTDSFSEQQHKLGPFEPIVEAKKSNKRY